VGCSQHTAPSAKEIKVAIRFIKKKSMLLLAIWVIIQGLLPLVKLPEPIGTYLPWAAAILAVVAGVLLILDM
jgi:hypothetical protein